MNGGFAFESQCDCNKEHERMKFMIPSDMSVEEMKRIVGDVPITAIEPTQQKQEKKVYDPMPFSKPKEGEER